MPLTKIQSLGITDGTITAADLAAGVGAGKFESALLHVRDEKSSTTNGGTSVTSYTARDLNTVVTNEISGASLATNQITLPSGTYFIYAFAPGYNVGTHSIKLRNTTDSSDTILGIGSYNNDGASTISIVVGRFTIAAQKVFEIQHRTTSAQATNGLGVSKGFGDTNIYTNVQIWKVA
jgi:hypothetical protein